MNSKLINHKNKCRCCLAKFRRRNDKLLITPTIQQKFQDLTRAEVSENNKITKCFINHVVYLFKLKLTDEYSKFICHNCYNELNATDKLRRSIMIESQIKIADYKDLSPHLMNRVVAEATREQIDYVNKVPYITSAPPKPSEIPEDLLNNTTIPNEIEQPATNIHQNTYESETK